MNIGSSQKFLELGPFLRRYRAPLTTVKQLAHEYVSFNHGNGISNEEGNHNSTFNYSCLQNRIRSLSVTAYILEVSIEH